MSDIKRIETGPRMSQAVIHGDTVYLAGQVGAPGESVTAQTKAVLASVEALLAQAGSDKDHLLNATIYLKDIGSGFAPKNEVWSAWLSPGMAPTQAKRAQVCAGISRLTSPSETVMPGLSGSPII